jgi:hypothetical protein
VSGEVLSESDTFRILAQKHPRHVRRTLNSEPQSPDSVTMPNLNGAELSLCSVGVGTPRTGVIMHRIADALQRDTAVQAVKGLTDSSTPGRPWTDCKGVLRLARHPRTVRPVSVRVMWATSRDQFLGAGPASEEFREVTSVLPDHATR